MTSFVNQDEGTSFREQPVINPKSGHTSKEKSSSSHGCVQWQLLKKLVPRLHPKERVLMKFTSGENDLFVIKKPQVKNAKKKNCAFNIIPVKHTALE